MAGSVNKVIIVGNLGAEPDVRDLPSGQKVANLRVATSEQWKDRVTGERRERTEWHTVGVFDQNSVQYAQNYLGKGSKVYVEGVLETRKWRTSSGEDRYSTEVIVRPVIGKLVGLSSGGEGNRIEDQNKSVSSGWPDINDDVPF